MNKTMPNGVAPTGDKYKIGAKGGRVGQAWQEIWNRLDHDNYVDARPLAEDVAEQFGIQYVSIMSHLHRMAHEGHLDTTNALAEVTVHKFQRAYVGHRMRMHIRLPAKEMDQAA